MGIGQIAVIVYYILFAMKCLHRFYTIVSVLIFSGVLHAQIQHPVIDRAAYKAALETELSISGRDRYLYEHADAYSRLMELRVFKRLGYDLTKISPEIPVVAGADFSDTGSVKNVTRNTSDQNETTIAINRLDQKIIVAGANDTRMYSSGMPSYTSTDGGKNWHTNFIPIPPAIEFTAYEAYGDPALSVDDSGYFYYAYLAGDNSFKFDNLIVATSKNGRVWKNGGYIVPIPDIGGFEDKEHICVDRNPKSPFYGRVYVAWVHFPDNSGQLGGGARIAWSDDKCQTWSSVVPVTETLIEFAEVKTGRNGEVILTFSSADGESGGVGVHEMYTSLDGGQTFTGSDIAGYTGYPVNNISRPGLKGPDGFRCYPYIAEDIDQKTNRIHLVYGSWNANDTIQPAAVLYYITSSDLGTSWSEPKPVGIANPAHSTLSVDRFCPWVSVNQKTGDAYALYYSSEDDTTDNQLVSVYRAKLTGGMTEYPRFIGDRDFDPSFISRGSGVAPFIGDYIGSDASDTVYAAAWTENRVSFRDGDIFVYVATPTPTLGPTTSVKPVVINSVNLWLSTISPNPVANRKFSFSYYFPSATIAEIALYSSIGVKVKTLAQEKFESGTYTKECRLEGLPSGAYFLRLSTNYGSVEKGLVVSN